MRDFFQVVVINQLGGNPPTDINITLPNPFEDGEATEPFYDEQGKFSFILNPPDTDERHTALGKFMDAWSRLEAVMSDLLSGMLSTDRGMMPVLMNSLGTRGQLDVLGIVGGKMFDEDFLAELSGIIGRIKQNNTRRNNIVHGHWMAEVLIRRHGDTPAVVYQWFRVYLPSNIDEANLSRERQNVKEREKYYFSIPRIRSITYAVIEVSRQLVNFTSQRFPT